MGTTPNEIFATAKRLSSFENLTEADLRAIVSRAYYAALHGVSECFIGKIQVNQTNTHELIIDKADRYGRSINPGRTEAKRITRNMYLFKKMRKAADYEIRDDFEKADANNALVLGESVLEDCGIVQQKLSHNQVV